MSQTLSDQPAGDRVRRVDARRNLEAIIDAAVPLLCEHPRASMQQIAAAAGLHRATVHRHFPSRDDLLDELRQRAYIQSLEGLDAVMAEPSTEPGDTLERAAAALIAPGDRYRLHCYTTWRSTENRRHALEIGEGLIAIVSAAQAAGQARTDLPAQQLAAAVGGLVFALLPQIADGDLTVAAAARTVRIFLSAPAA